MAYEQRPLYAPTPAAYMSTLKHVPDYAYVDEQPFELKDEAVVWAHRVDRSPRDIYTSTMLKLEQAMARIPQSVIMRYYPKTTYIVTVYDRPPPAFGFTSRTYPDKVMELLDRQRRKRPEPKMLPNPDTGHYTFEQVKAAVERRGELSRQ